MSAIINLIEPNSIAQELSLAKGDKIISVNKEKFVDILEYRFLIAEEYIELFVKKADGEEIIFEIEKDEYEDLGIEFENSLIDNPKTCKNKCIFCFIDQLPKGLRKTLYFKDDDTRLSFLNGNYVTLTNISDKELDKIIRLRLSPINVSVHTTNGDLRKFMLNNKNAGDIIFKIKKLTDSGITVNCQIVLVKGVNDEAELERTINDLSVLYPNMHSISVVPVGISKYREKLFELTPFDSEDSGRVVDIITALQEKFLKEHGSRIVYAADEFYVKSKYDIPDFEIYEDFPQIENGVGLVSSFYSEIKNELKRKPKKSKVTQKTIVTGVCAYPFIKDIAEMIMRKYTHVTLNVVCAYNNLFGEQITVVGLLCGEDILKSLSETEIGDALILSRDTLRAEGDMFLDNMTKEELSKRLNTKIIFASNCGKDFIDKIIN